MFQPLSARSHQSTVQIVRPFGSRRNEPVVGAVAVGRSMLYHIMIGNQESAYRLWQVLALRERRLV